MNAPSSSTVLVAPDYSMSRLLRGYVNFEDQYQGEPTTQVIWLSDRKDGKDPLAKVAFDSLRAQYQRQGKTFSPPLTDNETGVDPFLIRGLPVPIGAWVILYLPVCANAVSGSLQFIVGWRLRGLDAYATARAPYHQADEGDGRNDDGSTYASQMGLGAVQIFDGAAMRRRLIISGWQSLRYPPAYSALAPTPVEKFQIESFGGYDDGVQGIFAGDQGNFPGIVPDTKVIPALSQGILPNATNTTTFYHPIVIKALGDEMLLGVRPQNANAEVNYDFNDDELELSYYFGRNGFNASAGTGFGTPLVPNEQLGVYVVTGTGS